MDFLEKQITTKNNYILGQGKIQEDFEYIFDWIDVKGYMLEDQSFVDKLGVKVDKKFNKGKDYIIVCNQREVFLLKEDTTFVYKEDFVHIDDLLYILDKDWNEPWEKKNCVIWGTGNTAKDLLEQIKLYNVDVNIPYFISSQAEEGERFLGKEVYPTSAILESKENELIVVANGAYEEIREELIKSGKKEDIDFTNFMNFVSFMKRSTGKPSKMMKKTMYARQINAPFCMVPFEVAFLSSEMECCCDAMVNTSIGGVRDSDLTSVWKSVSARIFRLSIINKTFCFCIWENCIKFDGKLEDASGRFACNVDAREYPKRLQINIDETCNLYCKSCRTKISVATGTSLKKHHETADYLIQSGWLEKCENIILAGYGEVFASQVYEKILYGMNQTKRKNITILTNLLLFTPKKWEMIEGKYEDVSFEVSVDASKKETYEYLRRGGNWEIIQKRLQFLSELKREGKVNRVVLNMVVQRENYREIEDFVKMTEEFGFDVAYLQKMFDLGSFDSEEDYLYQAMLNKNGQPLSELREVLHGLDKSSCANIEHFNLLEEV